MARKKKKGILPRVEVLIVLVFFLCFIIWAMSKCDTKKTLMEQIATEQAEEEAVEEAKSESLLGSLDANDSERPVSESKRQANPSTSNAPTPTQVIKEYKTKLYVTIDGLKFRTGPSMDSTVIMTLPLDQELDFMNEVSDSTEQISLGNGVMADERWVKVQHWKGHKGWVYGAGVSYFKLSQ